MALGLASPGIKIKEVDLTRGGVSNTVNLTAGIAAPFEKGPVNQIVRINNENELVTVFGKPSKNDSHYEYWYSASNFIGYGGALEVVRCSGTNLRNSNAGVGSTSSPNLQIENFDDYQTNHSTASDFYWAARNPGYWADGIKVCVIDNFADQILSGVNTTSVAVGAGVTQTLTGTIAGVGTTSAASGYLKGLITGIGASTLYVKVTSVVVGGTETSKDYTENGTYEFKTSSVGIGTTITVTPTSKSDWYKSQKILDVANGDYSTIYWSSIAPRPATNKYVLERNGANDALHVVVFDSKKLKSVTGTPQAFLEKFVNLSKAVDGLASPSQKIYYKDYIAQYSQYLFAGGSLGNSADTFWGTTPVATKFSGETAQSTSLGNWGLEADGVSFNVIGNKSFTLSGGKDYSGTDNIGGLTADLNSLVTAYDKFSSDSESNVRFLLQGSTSLGKYEEQAKANKLIEIAESRKDCIAFISPYKDAVVNVPSSATQLSNVLEFFSTISSSSYAVFDSGYQYVYDRFNQQFVYMPCSADIAGICVRTDIDQYPWYSPAGKTRGNLRYAIKLAYNPGQDDRDKLYSSSINPIITSPGSGIILYGDKTALRYQSAFDRINVRRLFIEMEQAIKSAANDQLFQFNDATTRANFINIVEPYLRDIQIKRGITDFRLICDESNNTPDVIDRNEFIADIYVKPARSINFIGLTFVATRTGVSFESIIGTV